MSTKIEEESLGILYIRWSKEDPKVCTACGSPIEFLYNDGGRTVITLHGKIQLYTCYYSCSNPSCSFSDPFTLPQEVVLPYKHYGLDVWRWVITDHVEFHDSYESIAKRLRVHYTLEISPNTVKAILETYFVACSQDADQKTLELVQKAGRVYVALDGQRPNNGESGLWLFIDTITNRILHLEYLKSASWDVLKAIFQKIEAKYGVPIEAVISDHQKSIIKAVKEFSPTIPHQFCHYHFIKNLHRTINALDSHLHVSLTEVIHQLYICNLQPLANPIIVHGQELNRRKWVAPIVDDLFQMVQEKTRDFDIFAGYNLYRKLQKYLEILLELSQEVLPIERLHNLIKRTILALKKALISQAPLFQKLDTLIPLFYEARRFLGRTPVPEFQFKVAAAQWEEHLRQLYHTLTGHLVPKNLKWQHISAKSALEDIIAEWVRLYSTHKQGLFHFLKMDTLPRSNVALEKIYSLEVHHFRMTSGRAQVGNMVRVKGGELCIVQQNYAPDLINRVLLHQDRAQVKAGIAEFRARHQLQAAAWHTQQPRTPRIRQLIQKTHELLTNP